MTFVQAAPQVNPGIFPSLKAKSSQMSYVFSDISKQNECSEVISISLPVFVFKWTFLPRFPSFASFCPLLLFSLHAFPFACSPNVCWEFCGDSKRHMRKNRYHNAQGVKNPILYITKYLPDSTPWLASVLEPVGQDTKDLNSKNFRMWKY